MPKVTQQEIEIIKRIAAIQGLNHVMEKHYNPETDREEAFDCIYSAHRIYGFEWRSAYETFEEFISGYAQWQYDNGYEQSSRW